MNARLTTVLAVAVALGASMTGTAHAADKPAITDELVSLGEAVYTLPVRNSVVSG